MKLEIRHRRLHAFYSSKVLNGLMIVIVVSLLLMGYTQSMVLPVICGAIALSFFIGYSLWLWIKKPKSIIINNRLSNVSGVVTLYFLIIIAIDATNEWWYIIPIAFSVVILFISMIDNRDEKYDI